MLIPQKPKRQKKISRKWFNKKKIKKIAKKELSTKTKNLVEKYSKSQMKQVVYSYMCPQCKKSFRAENLRSQIVESARRKDTYISCPKCNTALIVDKLMKVSTKQSSKVNRNANLTITYPNQGIVPEYAPNSWTDRALLEKMAHELGKFAEKTGMFNPQLKFQRGLRGKISSNMRAAEYTIEAVDNYDLRFRVIAAAGITPAGKVVLPKFFMTLGGKEIPFTKEAVAEFLAGKVFAPADPKPVVPHLYYKDRDPVRFREIVASKKAVQVTWEELNALPKDKKIELLQKYKEDLIQPDIENMQDEGLESDEAQGRAGEKFDRDLELKRIKFWWEERFKHDWEDGYIVLDQNVLTSKKKKAAGTTTPGQKVEYQGKMYTVDSITGDASILTDEAGTQTAPVPNTDLNIQFEEGATPAEITAPTLAERKKTAGRDFDFIEPQDLPNGWTIQARGWWEKPGVVFYMVEVYQTNTEGEEGYELLWNSKEVDEDDEPAVNAAEIVAREMFEQYKEEVSKREPPKGFQYSLAERIDKLVKRSLRDEKTLVPFTDPDPDYSVAKQTDVDPDFGVPYEKSDQGILPEEERAIQRMFRGGSSVKPVKTAAGEKEASIQKFALTTWYDCNVEEPEPGYIVKGEEGEGTVVGGSDKHVDVQFPTGVKELYAGDDFVFISKPYKLYDVEGNYIPVKENYEKEQEELSRESSLKKTAKIEPSEDLLKEYAKAYWSTGDFDAVWEGLKEEGHSKEEIEEFLTQYGDKIKELSEYLSKEELEEYLGESLDEGGKEASRKKTAEPTGYHETDDTGKVIELSRLRTLVQDYARAGQLPLDFDLTKVMSEVSRMNREQLLDILDKKQKGQHYPVVHAKRKGLEKKAIRIGMSFVGDEVLVIDPDSRYRGANGKIVSLDSDEDIIKVEFTGGKVEDFHSADLEPRLASKKTVRIKSKSTNAIVREIRKADLTEKDIEKDIKDEEEGEKHYKEQAKEVEDEKAKKVLEEAAEDEADHAEELEEVVLPAVEEERNTKNYLEKYDSRKKKTAVVDKGDTVRVTNPDSYHYKNTGKVTYVELDSFGNLFFMIEFPDGKIESFGEGGIEKVGSKKTAQTDKFQEGDKVKVVFDQSPYYGEEGEILTGSTVANWIVRFPDGSEETFIGADLEKVSSKKTAQEEEEKPKTEFKELKTKPHGRPAPEEVAEAPAAAPEMRDAFNEVRSHKQRLMEIKAIVADARRKVEEQVREIQKEQRYTEETASLQEGIEKLSSLIEQAESQVIDLGEFFAFLDTSMKTKKFKPSDKWRVEKLLEKFGEEAKNYLARAEKGAVALDEEIAQRLLTVFPKLQKGKESAVRKRADVFNVIADLGSNLWSYVKAISGIISEGEQLELAL